VPQRLDSGWLYWLNAPEEQAWAAPDGSAEGAYTPRADLACNESISAARTQVQSQMSFPR